MVLVMLVSGCSPQGGEVIATEPLWDDGVFGVSLLMHNGYKGVLGEACVDDRCWPSEPGGRVWLDGLEPGEHVIELIGAGSAPTITAVDVRQDYWARASLQAYEDGLVQRFLPDDAWQRRTTGLVDLWVRDQSDPAFEAMAGVEVEAEGDVYISGGGSASLGTVTVGGGPVWIANLPPGETTVQITAPGYTCRHDSLGWPTDDASKIRLPVEARTVTTVWMSCTPLEGA